MPSTDETNHDNHTEHCLYCGADLGDYEICPSSPNEPQPCRSLGK